MQAREGNSGHGAMKHGLNKLYCSPIGKHAMLH